MNYKLIHDESFAEESSGFRYVVLKVLNEENIEVGQVKLEFDEDENPVLKLTTHGNITILHDDCFPA